MLNYSYTFIYIILTAISMVFINHAATFLPPALTLFLGTIIAIITFHLINIRQIKNIYQQAWKTKWLWLRMMCAVTAMWVSTIYGPAYATPAVYILIYFAANCILGTVFSYSDDKNIYWLVSGAGVLICTALITLHYMNAFIMTEHTMLGMLMGLVGGLATYIYSKQSYAFSKENKFSATQILMVRFWLVEIFCLFLLPASPQSYLTSHTLLIIFGIALASLILPIFFVLKGILAIGAEKSSMLCGLIPAVTYILQTIILHHPYNIFILLLYLLTGIFIALPYIVKLKTSKSLN